MDAREYIKILGQVMRPYASENMPLFWLMKQDNEPKHIGQKAKKLFPDKKCSFDELAPRFKRHRNFVN